MTASAPAEAGRPFAALLSRDASRREPPWLTRLRSRARERFEAAGLPRPDDEDWRQTNVRPLAAMPFRTAAGSDAAVDLAAVPWAASAQRRIARHPAAGRQGDLHQLTGREHTLDVLIADEHLSAACAAAGEAAHAGALDPQFRHGLFLQPPPK